LQQGDISTAGKYFVEASELRTDPSNENEQLEGFIDSSLLLIAQGSYPEAFALLQRAAVIQPDNLLVRIRRFHKNSKALF